MIKMDSQRKLLNIGVLLSLGTDHLKGPGEGSGVLGQGFCEAPWF